MAVGRSNTLPPMIHLEFSEADITALDYERYHHPHLQVQRRLSRVRSKTSLVTYLREYEAGGIESLKQLDYKGQPSKLNEHIPSLEAHFAAHPLRQT